jgi:hypothetical protein
MYYGKAVALISGYRVSCCENPRNCLLSDPLRHLIKGANTGTGQRLEDIKDSPRKLPGNHAEHFDNIMIRGNGLVIIFPIWDPECEWRPDMAYELFVVVVDAAKDSI